MTVRILEDDDEHENEDDFSTSEFTLKRDNYPDTLVKFLSGIGSGGMFVPSVVLGFGVAQKVT